MEDAVCSHTCRDLFANGGFSRKSKRSQASSRLPIIRTSFTSPSRYLATLSDPRPTANTASSHKSGFFPYLCLTTQVCSCYGLGSHDATGSKPDYRLQRPSLHTMQKYRCPNPERLALASAGISSRVQENLQNSLASHTQLWS